jgi:hypothetical protein
MTAEGSPTYRTKRSAKDTAVALRRLRHRVGRRPLAAIETKRVAGSGPEVLASIIRPSQPSSA